jgi:hypothetical protein
MCINRIANKEKWLKDKPKVITAYKVAIACYSKELDVRLYPVFNNDKYFKRNNLLRKVKSERSEKYQHVDGSKNSTYIAYYHLFAKRKDAERHRNWMGGSVIECTVPKKYITEIGYQYGHTVIVTRKFSIVGEDEFLD